MLRRSLLALSFLTISAAALSSQAMGQPVPSKSGNHCKDEAIEMLEERFGSEAKLLNAMIVGSDDSWALWAQTNLCDGYIVIDFSGRKSVCKEVAYGRRPARWTRAWGYGKCDQVLPRDIYPHN